MNSSGALTMLVKHSIKPTTFSVWLWNKFIISPQLKSFEVASEIRKCFLQIKVVSMFFALSPFLAIHCFKCSSINKSANKQPIKAKDKNTPYFMSIHNWFTFPSQMNSISAIKMNGLPKLMAVKMLLQKAEIIILHAKTLRIERARAFS